MRAQDAAVSYTAFRRIDETGNRLGRLVPVPARLSYRQLLKNTAIATLTGMVDTAKTAPIRMPVARAAPHLPCFSTLKPRFLAHRPPETLAPHPAVPAPLP